MLSDIVLRHELLRSEKVRLATFADWNFSLSANLLAAAGFYYTNVSDVCVCFSCELSIQSWCTETTPFRDHVLFAPECGFVRGLDKNIPILDNDVPPLSQAEYEEVSRDKTRLLVNVHNNLRKRNYTTIILHSVNTIIIPKPDIFGGMMNVNGFFNHMKKTKNRSNTFKRFFGATFFQKPISELVENGLFSLSTASSVQCFSCRCILGNWKSTDSVMARHFRSSPHCSFLCSILPENVAADKISETTCRICYMEPFTHTADPCGHVFCGPCLSKIDKKCAHCRAPIKKAIKLFI